LVLITFLNIISFELVSFIGSAKYSNTNNYIFPLGLVAMFSTINLILITSFGINNKLNNFYWISPVNFIFTVVLNFNLIKYFGVYGILLGNILISAFNIILVFNVSQRFYRLDLPIFKIINFCLICVLTNLIISFTEVIPLYKLILFCFTLFMPFFLKLIRISELQKMFYVNV